MSVKELESMIEELRYDWIYNERRQDFILMCYAVLAGMVFGTAVMLAILSLS